MQYLIVTACRVDPSRTREFFSEVRQWEEAAMASPDAPEDHAVYLDRADPTRALIMTRFSSKDRADRFGAEGHFAGFTDRLMRCGADIADGDAYDLFYAMTADGGRVVFGESG